jgi:hypothetical protein
MALDAGVSAAILPAGGSGGEVTFKLTFELTLNTPLQNPFELTTSKLLKTPLQCNFNTHLFNARYSSELH